jgi:hypothetical protein
LVQFLLADAQIIEAINRFWLTTYLDALLISKIGKKQWVNYKAIKRLNTFDPSYS